MVDPTVARTPHAVSLGNNRDSVTRTDPVRWVVQAALALYLSPVLLLVGLIGGGSILIGGLARASKFSGHRSSGRVHPQAGKRALRTAQHGPCLPVGPDSRVTY